MNEFIVVNTKAKNKKYLSENCFCFTDKLSETEFVNKNDAQLLLADVSFYRKQKKSDFKVCKITSIHYKEVK